jgi:hypothetical protein
VSDKSRYISVTELFLGLSLFFVSKTFQNSLSDIHGNPLTPLHCERRIWILTLKNQASGYFLRVFFYDAGGCAAAPLRRAASAVVPVVSITIPRRLCQMLLNVICHTTHCVYIYNLQYYNLCKIHTYIHVHIHIYIYDVYKHIYIDILQSITTTTDNVFRFLAGHRGEELLFGRVDESLVRRL